AVTQRIDDEASLFVSLDELGVLEDREVVRHVERRNLQRFDDLRHILRAVRQQANDAQTLGCGKRSKQFRTPPRLQWVFRHQRMTSIPCEVNFPTSFYQPPS